MFSIGPCMCAISSGLNYLNMTIINTDFMFWIVGLISNVKPTLNLIYKCQFKINIEFRYFSHLELNGRKPGHLRGWGFNNIQQNLKLIWTFVTFHILNWMVINWEISRGDTNIQQNTDNGLYIFVHFQFHM